MRKSGIYTAVFAAFLMTTTAFAADVTPSVNAQTADSANSSTGTEKRRS